MNTPANTLINTPIISRIRRNHGLEHATIHILSKKIPGKRMAGHSDPNGFWIIGDLETEDVRTAIEEGLARMRAGEHKLAVHPNCGTNFVTSGVFAGIAASLALLGAKRFKDKLANIPLAISFATLALIFSHPLGFIIQERFTTSGHPGNMQIVSITPTRRGNLRAHRITTAG